MAKTILIPRSIAARNVDSYNKNFIATTDLDNGSLLVKGALSTKANETQVFEAGKPATGSLSGLYMAFSPEDTVLTDELGNQYKVGNLDPRAFTNKAGIVFNGFAIHVGDEILISADGIEGSADDYAIAADGEEKLQFASNAGTGLTFKVIETTYISVASANAIGSQRVTAYRLECVQA